MTAIEDQGELALARAPQRVTVPFDMVRAKRTCGAAFTLACDTSGLDDKEIYMAIPIDAGYFSNIKKGKATLQGDLVADFCRVVGNTVYVDWLAYQIGCALVLIKSEAERRAEAEKARADRLEGENALMRQLLAGRTTP